MCAHVVGNAETPVEGITLKPDGTFDTARLVENLKRIDVDDRFEFIYQALNEFLFFETFVLGESLEEEALEKFHDKLETVLRESAEVKQS